MNATPKQISLIRHLLHTAGYSTTYMNSSFKAFGASMKQRSGTVQAWLEGLSKEEASSLIDKLKEEE